MSGRKMLDALFVILLVTGMAFAQEFRGRVQGLVTDQTGGGYSRVRRLCSKTIRQVSKSKG